ncbi:MAG: hypothetical protein AAGI17_07900, partial [Planctomycetota bacterium]
MHSKKNAQFGAAALIAAAGFAVAQPLEDVEFGAVDVQFNPFAVVATTVGNVDVDSPDVGIYTLLNGGTTTPRYSPSVGVLLSHAAELGEGTNGSFNSSVNIVNNFFEINTFVVDGLVEVDDGMGGITLEQIDNGAGLPDRNIAIDADFSFVFFPFSEFQYAGHAFVPSSTPFKAGPLNSINSPRFELISEGDFPAFDAGT